MKTNKTLRRLVEGGLIAAMYAALTLAIPAASYGPVQFRVAEMLTILPLFTPAAIPGLTVGCAVSNFVGLTMGANPAGAWDILFGSFATLAAAWMTYGLRNIKFKGLPVAATLPPVIMNAAVVGLELTLVYTKFTWAAYAVAALDVAAGEFAAATVCGLLLYAALERSGAAKAAFRS